MNKWTTQKKNKLLKQGEKELQSLQFGSSEYIKLLCQIEYVKEKL